MHSKIVGKTPFNDARLETEIDAITNFKFSQAYKEFAFGDWKSCVLWNGSGDENDAFIKDYPESAMPTGLGKLLPYLNEMMTSIFNTKYLKFARIFAVTNYGLIVPHRDYLELKDPLSRFHIPLQIDDFCFNSEDNSVYSMKKGEIWFLDASRVHSAACFSKILRLNLVLDFVGDVPFRDLFADDTIYSENIPYTTLKRQNLSHRYREQLLGLAKIIDQHNFKDIVGLLAKIHFYKNVDTASMFEWLIEIATISGNKQVLRKALVLKEECILNREHGILKIA